MLQLLAYSETLFVIDDIIADEGLDKKRKSLLRLAISSRHHNLYLWLLAQSYSAIPKNLRRQAKAIFVWYSKERGSLEMIHCETYVLTGDELSVVWGHVKKSTHVRLYIRNEHRRGFCVK